MKRIAIIGGGAAGMMAAARIQEVNPECVVVLFEKNAVLGRKVMISGGGRCNVTTGVHDVRELLTRYMRGAQFLTNAMWNFPPADVYDWFEAHGVPLKTEEDMRVFPQSNNGEDVVGVFRRLFADSGVELRLKTSVQNVATDRDGFTVVSDSGEEQYDAVILTTGGQAYRHTGSTGDGYAFAEALGHTVTPLAASLNAFVLQEEWMRDTPGVSFADIGMRIPEHPEFSAHGPVVCTHTGLSGPAVFALSAQVAFLAYTKETPLAMEIDWLRGHNEEQLRSAIDAACDSDPKQSRLRLLQQWLPKSMITQLLRPLNQDPQAPLASFSKAERRDVLQQLKRCMVHIVGRSAGSEFVTAGGVNTDEINPSTMESRITPGLYFGGELMNVDGVTGGFNLQASWAAGRLAGENAAEADTQAE